MEMPPYAFPEIVLAGTVPIVAQAPSRKQGALCHNHPYRSVPPWGGGYPHGKDTLAHPSVPHKGGLWR